MTGAAPRLVVGDEITTKETFFGHFNAFPLPVGAAPIP